MVFAVLMTFMATRCFYRDGDEDNQPIEKEDSKKIENAALKSLRSPKNSDDRANALPRKPLALGNPESTKNYSEQFREGQKKADQSLKALKDYLTENKFTAKL